MKRAMQLSLWQFAFAISSYSNIFAIASLNLPRQENSASSLFIACTNYVATCPLSLKSCANFFCDSCASFAGPPFVSCCEESTATACFESLAGITTGSTRTAATTNTIISSSRSAHITLDSNSISCDSAFDMIRSCASETLSFTDRDDADQASCLCYSRSTFDPWPFDNLQSACVSYAKTADTTDVALFTSAAGLCTRIGNVRSATAIVSSPGHATPSPVSSIPVSTTTLQPISTSSVSGAAVSGAASREQASGSWLFLILAWLF